MAMAEGDGNGSIDTQTYDLMLGKTEVGSAAESKWDSFMGKKIT